MHPFEECEPDSTHNLILFKLTSVIEASCIFFMLYVSHMFLFVYWMMQAEETDYDLSLQKECEDDSYDSMVVIIVQDDIII